MLVWSAEQQRGHFCAGKRVPEQNMPIVCQSHAIQGCGKGLGGVRAIEREAATVRLARCELGRLGRTTVALAQVASIDFKPLQDSGSGRMLEQFFRKHMRLVSKYLRGFGDGNGEHASTQACSN